uniref:PHD finger protein 6 n=1 Tax=Caenorhabditis tropicalis TaxID=1561998 RepID=A0A1I7UUY7_9PELO
MKEMVGGCCVCADDNGWTDNPLIYCDGEDCEVAVHQGCYGIQEVPDGNWYCAKCTTARTMMAGQINEATFCCQLCPFDYGALKRTDRNGWAHVICALYIPEVRFGNVHSMEPVILTDVPVDKFQKTCYICAEERPNDSKKGACMSCNKTTCKRSFHVTCAQRKGLLCEEGGVSKNVKYCGYCENHLKKAEPAESSSTVVTTPTVSPQPTEAPQQLEESGPLHYYGENMVVKSSREMFSNVDILSDGRYFCCLCNRAYKNHATLTAHLRGVHLRQEAQCPEVDCNHISYTENERRKHQKIHEKQKYSRISRESLRAQQRMEEKMVTKLGLPTENAIHEQVDGRQVAGTISYVDRRGKTRYKCTMCPQSFQHTLHATRHIETHSNTPKECFYCGDIRSGSMDLHVHYMRFHRNEGVRTITCKACGCGFTTTTLFRNHAKQAACELACQNLLIRQDIYYGELPEGTTIDHLTLHRLNFFRKRQEERAAETATMLQMEEEKEEEEEPKKHQQQIDDEIFVGANALIQTEFGLKNMDEYRSSKKRGSESRDPGRQKRMAIPSAVYAEQQPPLAAQNDDIYGYTYPPPAYGYDPLIGIYPDFQPMQQLQYHYYKPFEDVDFYENPEDYRGGNGGVGEKVVMEQRMKEKREEQEEHEQQQQDVIFDELDKLDFVSCGTSFCDPKYCMRIERSGGFECQKRN